MQSIKDMASNAMGGGPSGPAGPQGGVLNQGAPAGQHNNNSTSDQQSSEPQQQQQQQQQTQNQNGSDQVVEPLVLRFCSLVTRQI